MLYEIERDNPEESRKIEVSSPANFGIKERDIEGFLTSHLSEIVSADHLMLIGRQRAFQEEADLLALDKEGVLYIFELKRWESNPENILQVMRYGQKFGRYTYDQLQDLARNQQRLEGDLKEAHKEYFDLKAPLEESLFNHGQVFVLVTNGTDADTISAVDYWSRKGVKIECAPYRIYGIEGKPYIQFDTYNPEGDVILEGSPIISKSDKKAFIVSTNKAYMENAWRDMLGDLKKGKASAYGNRKYSIADIPNGSTVYLYHKGVGVIAKGIVAAPYRKVGRDDSLGGEYYVPLDFRWALKEEEWAEMAPTASEINEKLGAGHKFRHAVSTILEEDMIEAIDDIYADKCLRYGGEEY